MVKSAEIGIIGGSGFYEFLEGEEIAVDTPYGAPSDKILLAQEQGKKVAFLPRHGKRHHLPPHKINYRANLFALKKLGVRQVLAPCAVGSLKAEIEPGHFVIPNQLIDKTKSRKDTFFDGINEAEPYNKVAHISMAEPYCPELRNLLIQSCGKLNLSCHNQGIVVVIEGPRFSTKAESDFYAQFADVINMTQYPEAALARELEMCYANISLVTDYDAGLKARPACNVFGAADADRGDVKSVTAQEVIKTFKANTDKLKQLILEVIQNIQEIPGCSCKQALKDNIM